MWLDLRKVSAAAAEDTGRGEGERVGPSAGDYVAKAPVAVAFPPAKGPAAAAAAAAGARSGPGGTLRKVWGLVSFDHPPLRPVDYSLPLEERRRLARERDRNYSETLSWERESMAEQYQLGMQVAGPRANLRALEKAVAGTQLGQKPPSNKRLVPATGEALGRGGAPASRAPFSGGGT